MTFVPTSQQLEDLGFEKSGYTDAMMLTRGTTRVITYYVGMWNIGYVEIYPQSIEDIKVLIRLFTKQ